MLDDLLSLDDAARLIPGATRETLRRHARRGRLKVYRVGRRYMTTRADVEALVKARLVKPSNPDPRPQAELDDELQTELSRRALEDALAPYLKRRPR